MVENCKAIEAMSSCSGLHRDEIFEVLTRVPLESLGLCKRIFNNINELNMHNAYFMRLYFQRTGFASGYFVQSQKQGRYYTKFVSLDTMSSTVALDYLPCTVKIEATSSQGLLCCTTQGTRFSQYYICKPTTREWRRIPNPKNRYHTVKVAMVAQSNPLQFIIVRFSQPISQPDFRYNSLHCEMFDSKSMQWRASKQYIQLPFSMVLKGGSPILANGAFHWLTNQNSIFAFNIHDMNNWKLISLPLETIFQDSNFPDKKQLVEYEGRLTLLCMEEKWMELWVLSSNKIWTKRMQVNLECQKENEPNFNFGDFYTSDMTFFMGFHKVVWFNNDNHTSTEAKIDNICPEEVFKFQSNFECCHL